MDHIFRFHTNIYKEKGKFSMKKITRSFVPCCYGYRGRICCIDCLRRQLGFLCCQLDRYFRNGIHRSRERSC